MYSLKLASDRVQEALEARLDVRISCDALSQPEGEVLVPQAIEKLRLHTASGSPAAAMARGGRCGACVEES
jgi:hypothetical protein